MDQNPLRNRRVFISGPMTGIEHYNAPEFARAHAICREQGAAYVFDPSWEWMNETGEENTHEYYMRRCINVLTNGTFDTLLQLDGWRESEGCRLEYEVAVACGIRLATLLDDERTDERIMP